MPPPGLILLAAGGSTRMGRPKPLLPWGKSTLLGHACGIALQTALRPIVVVLGCEAEACRSLCDGLPVVTVVNRDWRKGLGSSISAGVAELERKDPWTRGAMILLADQPTVTPALLEMLTARWSPPARPIAATSYGNRAGVPALFDRVFFPELRALADDRGARELIAREKSRTAVVEPDSEPIDLDTPAGYRAHLRAQIRVSSFKRAHMPGLPAT